MGEAVKVAGAAAPAQRAVLEKVHNIFNSFGQTLRSYQLYGASNPATQRTFDQLRASFEDIWKEIPEIELWVNATSLLFMGKPVYENSNHSDSLAFLLFKDGIRTLTLSPGFEREELTTFTAVLHRARYQPSESDDLVTLLWDQDFAHVRHGYVDVESEQPDERQLAADLQEERTRLPLRAVSQEGASGGVVSKPPREGYDRARFPGSADPPAVTSLAARLQREPVQLDPEAVLYLQHEIETEMRRDVRADVVNALLDSLEVASPRARTEILEIFAGVIPGLVKARQLAAAVDILTQVREIGEQQGSFDTVNQREVQLLFEEVAGSAEVRGYLQALEAGEIQSDLESISGFFAPLGPAFLAPLLRAREKVGGRDVRAALESATERLAREHATALVDVLRSTDHLVVRGALRVQVGLGRTDVLPETLKLVKNSDVRVRLAAVEALVVLGGPKSLEALESALDDTARDVRVAALWGLATWEHPALTERLRRDIESKHFLDLEATEKIAMLDAYARVGGAEAVKLLGRLLRRPTPLHPKKPSDIRAYAARALGTTGSKAAQRVLEKCQKDGDAEVRRVVQRSLRKLG